MTPMGLWFAIGMAWAPVLGVLSQTLGQRTLTEGTRVAARTALTRTCVIASVFTAVAVASASALEGARPIPWVLGGVAFHLGWWVGARPLIGRDRDSVVTERDSSPPPTRRVASLVERRPGDAVPARLWAIPVGIVVASGAVLAWAIVSGALAAGSSTWIVINVWLAAVAFLVGWGIWARKSETARQDLSTAADPTEVDRLCREFRRFVARWLFVGATLAVLVFAGGAVAIAVWGESAGRVAGIIGGGGGVLVAIWGSVFGMLADRRRRAIIELGGVPPDVGTGARRSTA